MRTTKKLLMVLVLAVVFVVALVATAFAAMPTGINVGDTENGWTDAYKSTYEDIDNPDNGWIFYTTASGTDPLCRVQAGAETTTLVNAPGGAYFYYNKALKKGVVIAAGEVAGNSGDANEASLSSIADENKTHYAFFIVDNWTTIENHFATKTDIWSKGTNGVTLPTNLEETATKSIWATIYVSKSNYEAMKAAFATIDADDSLDSTAKRRAKAAEAKNYSTFYNNKNVPEEGALWTLGYLFKLMA
ncbi:MAG: hypothetical protein II292_02175, partial [Clostridia bacterium]|nr:hypothetical protein [Clostridia bacterium]